MRKKGNQRDAAIARNLTGVVLAVLALGLALNASGLVMPGGSGPAKLLQAITMLPMLCYLAAVWMIHLAFSALARGDAVERIVATLLVRVGTCMFLGGLLRVFVEPWLTRLALGRPWPWANFDVAAITLGTAGLFLILLARPLRHAAWMRAELDAIL
ncbi:DUF2975 domain-containing protein [Sphingomonas koreensis]|uniref:DUF2975 domain-containing protein n=1 Tax=Sphingomonas koreensis TaxID=93064 RepID=UPI000837A297|nr:DUF2975 domain-containing protein [Sphingomonas koreensis]PJI90878.1 Protein of unknown function (DUF2975) [Sphingomonas koreensis]RSU60155.1 DUF2975 domain-containing protein [Sphingomonas koreensis]RSU68095.1 DUF2975 domain-containing protein [Sphingomonas koreensis]